MSYIKSLFSIKKFSHKNVSIFSVWDTKTTFTKSTLIGRFVKIKDSKIGKYSRVNSGAKIAYTDIGNFSGISFGSRVGVGGHPTQMVSTSLIFHKRNIIKDEWAKEINFTKGRVEIGNDVWVGMHAMILTGVKIGDGAIIAAGSVVTKDVPSYAIVGGVPAKIIKYRFEPEVINKLLEIKWWDLSDEEISNKIEFFWEKKVDLEVINKYFL